MSYMSRVRRAHAYIEGAHKQLELADDQLKMAEKLVSEVETPEDEQPPTDGLGDVRSALDTAMTETYTAGTAARQFEDDFADAPGAE